MMRDLPILTQLERMRLILVPTKFRSLNRLDKLR